MQDNKERPSTHSAKKKWILWYRQGKSPAQLKIGDDHGQEVLVGREESQRVRGMCGHRLGDSSRAMRRRDSTAGWAGN